MFNHKMGGVSQEILRTNLKYALKPYDLFVKYAIKFL